MDTNRPDISNKAFWDVDFDSIDWHKYAGHVIVKVFESGTISDIAGVVKFYGKEKVREALIKAPFLSNETLHFSSALFKIPKQQFECFTTKQLMKGSIPL